MALELSGKDKAARVPLDYFPRVGAGRRRAAWIVFGLGLLVVGLALVSGYWRDVASPGPLHASHAAWENECWVCHAGTLEPTSSSNFLYLFRRQAMTTSDALCQKCHQGPPHHPGKEKAGEVVSCATCHADHKGRAAFRTRVGDARCTCCHSDLKAHTVGDINDYENRITRFDHDHPQFRAKAPRAADPGQLKFSHATHLNAGLTVKWTFADIKDAKLRQRYIDLQKRLSGASEVKPTDLVKLDCAACHQLDATDRPDPKGTESARAAGDYVLPVTYDQHCMACHPLTFRADLPNIEVPHHLQPPDVTRFLWGVFTEREKQLQAGAGLKARGADRPLPGKNLSHEELRKKVGPEVEKAKRFVFEGKATCGLCHEYRREPGVEDPLEVKPVKVPEVWFKHAKFSHRAHRAVSCLDCHAGATTSKTKDDILVPGIENCLKCHSTARTEGGQKLGGVRQDCVTCHRYHHSDAPMAGRLPASRGVKERRSIEAFLKGE
jgi:hypothetical protein